jgi:glycosyltransferase involved in cell wall biosynthesis
MKTLLISGIYRPEIGGPATYLPKLANQLLDQGWQAEVITLKDAKADPVIESWKVNYINRNQNILVRIIKTSLLIAKKAKGVDTVFANGLFQETSIGLLFLKKKSVAKVVGDPVWEKARNKGRTNLNIVDFNDSRLSTNQRLQRLFIRWSLNRFSVITCPSLELKLIITSWGVSKPIEFIPNGVVISENENIDKKYDLVSVSRLVNWKNIDKLIRASAKTKSMLAMVGSGPEEIVLKKLAKELNAPVEFLGQLEEEEVKKVLARSRIFALLSNYEGLSFALLQAMACGIPSVVSDVKGNSDVIRHEVEGLVVNIDNQVEIESAIEKLLGSTELLAKYGEAAKLKVKNEYDQKNQINKVINLMRAN